ncbi:MAG: sensor domain-containing diguanylate cyclase [Syntrophomonadaceae bacterium]|nr:sensor domain-containing diguanylate cyclase [Syntrophomonadaceae bacterium]
MLLSCYCLLPDTYICAFMTRPPVGELVAYLALAVLLLVLAYSYYSRQSHRPSSSSDENLKTILQHLNIFSWSYDTVAKSFKISSGTEKLCGRTARELMSRPDLIRRLVHPYDLPRVREAENDIQAGKKIMLEHRILLSDGSSRWVHSLALPLLDDKGKLYRMEGIIIDVTEQKEQEERMKHLAFYDALTGLPNRSMFENYFSNFLSRGKFYEQKMAVVFIDLDAFKGVNDELGHEAGDIVLKQSAMRMKSLLRGCDLLSRLGGDEFVALLTRIQDDSPALVGKRIVEAFWEPFIINGHSVNIGVSVGISIYPHDGADLETLIKHADEAMYMAKRRGKNTSCLYNPASLAR